MNIFYLDNDPATAARSHCDKHVVKMILETCQLLCTAHRLGGNTSPVLYKATHINHPSAHWVRLSSRNYLWAYRLLCELCKEYTYRYGRVHASERLLEPLRAIPKSVPNIGSTPIPQCMPDQYKVKDNPIQAYRNYYREGKASLLNYTKRAKPSWL
jgi:hypothetical protein